MAEEASRVWVLDTVKGTDIIMKRHAEGTDLGVLTHRGDRHRENNKIFSYSHQNLAKIA